MTTDLLSIARSATRAARTQLDVTAQNIANAGTDGYVRRTVSTEEVMTPGYVAGNRDVSLSGVRVTGVIRNADASRQAEVRRTGADTARADSEVGGLTDIQSALEAPGVYSAITGFETALTQLAQSPTDTPLRASVIAAAQTLSNSFNIASNQLDAVAKGQQGGASDGVNQINTMSAELAKVNGRLARMADIHGADGALKSAGRYRLFEMARTCDHCPHERKCARALDAASKPCAKDMDFCPNATEYAALTTESAAAHAS